MLDLYANSPQYIVLIQSLSLSLQGPAQPEPCPCPQLQLTSPRPLRSLTDTGYTGQPRRAIEEIRVLILSLRVNIPQFPWLLNEDTRLALKWEMQIQGSRVPLSNTLAGSHMRLLTLKCKYMQILMNWNRNSVAPFHWPHFRCSTGARG